MIIKDSVSGSPLLKCELPKGYETRGQMQLKQYPSNQTIHVEAYANKANCTIAYLTGESYVYEKQKLRPAFSAVPQGPQNDYGAWYATPLSLKDQLDQTAAALLNKKAEAKDYYDLSENMAAKAKAEFNKQISQLVEELQIGASVTAIPVGNIFRNYLLDGGMGIYEDKGRTLAVCFFRIGTEVDFVQGYGITENITGEPFGQASTGPSMLSSASWNIPYITYMITDSKEDLKTFMNFVDSVEMTPELQNYVEQNRLQVLQYQRQKAQMETMQTQQMINSAWAQQQQAWAASDRLRDSIHQDLDNFHNSLNQQMAQNDMRFQTGPSYGESSDDRIQRWRHESMMGVDTYERNDGTTVEYSNYADRVFENNLDSTSHFGTHHYYDDYVPEGWHELKKK